MMNERGQDSAPRWAALAMWIGAACGAGSHPPPAEPLAGAPVAPPSAPPAAAARDYDALAERVVEHSAGVRENEVVQVLGMPSDLPVMEALAIAIRRRGAFPLLTLTSERLERDLYLRVPEKYDVQPPQLELALAQVVSVIIDLLPISDEVWPGVPPERIARAFASREGLHIEQRKHKIRQVTIGNELYPSAARARRYGIDYPALERSYWGGLGVDPGVVAARARWLGAKLAGARVIEVTNPNGTHVTMSLAGRKIIVNDGVLSEAKRAAGGADIEMWLPAGELFVAPVARSVNGTIVVDRMMFQDTKVLGLRVELAQSRVTRMTARAGLDVVQRFYDAAGAGKELFSALDIGINPSVEDFPGAWLTSTVASGMITMGVGGNAWAGGENTLSFGILLYVPGSTLRADGEPLIADGVLQLPPGVK